MIKDEDERDENQHNPSRVPRISLPKVDLPVRPALSTGAQRSHVRAVSHPRLAPEPVSPRNRSQSFGGSDAERSPLAYVKTNLGVGTLHFKTVIVGDSFSGKTQLVQRLVHGCFNPSLQSTTKRPEVYMKWVQVEDYIVTLDLYDTAGQERSREALAPIFFRDSMICLVVYAINRRSSFLSARWWIERYLQHDPPGARRLLRSSTGEWVPVLNMALVGTHADLVHCRQVLRSEGEQLAIEYKINFIEVTSVSTNGAGELENQLCILAENAIDSIKDWRRHSDPSVMLSIREGENKVFVSDDGKGDNVAGERPTAGRAPPLTMRSEDTTGRRPHRKRPESGAGVHADSCCA